MDFRFKYRQAAVDFLSNISFDGYSNDNPDDKLSPFKYDSNSVTKAMQNIDVTSMEPSTSKKLPESGTGSLKLKPRKRLDTSKSRRHYTSHSTISTFDDPEKEVVNSKPNMYKKSKMVMVNSSSNFPFSVYSILAFTRKFKFVKPDGTLGEKSEANRSRLISGNSNSTVEGILAFGLIQIPGEEDVSYQHFLRPVVQNDPKSNLLMLPSKSQQTNGNISPVYSRRWLNSVKGSKEWKYDPNLLDDPDMITSRNKVVMQLPGYLTTIVNYVRPIDIKNDINEQFRQKFPDINLSLTKLRSLKSNILQIANKVGIDLWTIASAFVYFEILVLKNLISKQNRKLCCAASLLLSAKINDVKGTELNAILQELETTFKLHKKDILQYELYVFVALEFGLQLYDQFVNVHYRRLLRSV